MTLVKDIKRHLYITPEDRSPSTISLSSMGHCGRELAYKKHKTTPQMLDWKAKVVFDDGDMHHNQLRRWISYALDPSCYSLEDVEKKVSIKVSNKKVYGHVDGILRHNKDICLNIVVSQNILGEDALCTGEDILLEIKSMSSYSYDKLRRSRQVEKSYLSQIYAYLAATGLKTCILLAKNKDTADIEQYVIGMDSLALLYDISKLSKVMGSSTPSDVGRDYGPGPEKKLLPWNCGYCRYWKTCWDKYAPIEVSRNKVVLQKEYDGKL